jgi:hypothetical protein
MVRWVVHLGGPISSMPFDRKSARLGASNRDEPFFQSKWIWNLGSTRFETLRNADMALSILAFMVPARL